MNATVKKLLISALMACAPAVPFFIAIYSLRLPVDRDLYIIPLGATAILFPVTFMSFGMSDKSRQSQPLSKSDQTKKWLVIILVPLLFLALPLTVCGVLLFSVGPFSPWTETAMALMPFILFTPITVLFFKLDKVQKKGFEVSKAVVRHSRIFGGTPNAGIDHDAAQCDPDQWRLLLQELSDLALRDDRVKARLTEEQIRKRWLGEPPAAEHQLVAAEERLAVRLSPSHRSFLSVSNGWHFPHYAVARLGGAESIGWTEDMDPDLVRLCELGIQQAESRRSHFIPITERYLAQTLMINVPQKGDDGHCILNPAVMNGEEMDAWFFTTWDEASVPHVSFWHLMAHLRDKMRCDC